MPTILRLLSAAAIIAAATCIPAHAAGDACSLLTTAQVTAAMGTPVNDGTPGPKNCIWHVTKGDGNTYLTLRDTSGYDQFKSTAQMTGQMVPVPGLGDDAFLLASDKSPSSTLYVKKGSTVILIMSRVSGNTAAQNQAIEKTLAAQAIAKL